MNTTQHIRILAAADLVLFVLAISTSFNLESRLHPLLQEYLQLEAEWDFSRRADIFLLISIPVLVVNFVSLFGLVFRQSWAANVFFISSIIFLILGLFTGPAVDHAVPNVLGGLACMSEGVILYLLIFSDSELRVFK